jgi:chitodextrinase
MFRSKVVRVIAVALMGSIVSTTFSSPSASAVPQNLTFNCDSNAPVTLYVDPDDSLLFIGSCGAVMAGAYNEILLYKLSVNFTGPQIFFVSPSATPGTYANAIDLYAVRHTLYTIIVRASAPGRPTIGTATALSPTSASVSFSAPFSNGGATIETYTATSTPGGITGQVLQSGSGSITITGLTPATAYTFRVTASNSAGTSTSSDSSVSITTPSSDADNAAAALAAQRIAEAKREAEKQAARGEVTNSVKTYKDVNLELFTRAEIPGVTAANIAAVQAEIAALPQTSRADLSQVLKIARKYEVVGKIASDQFTSIHSDSLIEIGLIPQDSKQKAAITAAIKKLPPSDRSSYASIKKAIDAEMAEIQNRKDRLAKVITRNASRYTK